ncbi:Transthyretin-like family protein [Ancylostoma ceylanicum]|uniref:Transthyretin-like family protein n=1 Tax=Ancylostoma ceylanicum TaxID=53326 RepID=A0A0D6LH08_9BILA|nr:Transthyretin-like family protein [Ancylostoma ceylanicum]
MIPLLLCLALPQVSSYSTSPLITQQTVQVQGKLICNGSAYFDAKVILFNNQLGRLQLKKRLSEAVKSSFENTLRPIFANMRLRVPLQLAETKPNNSGDFTVAWTGSNLVAITPIVNIYHRCHYQQTIKPIKICARVLSIQVPNDYVINNANGPNATYDIGTVNLNIKYTFELVDCIFGAYSS